MRKLSRVVPLLFLAALSAGAEGCGGEPRIEIHGQEARRSSMFGGACSIFLKIRNPGTGGDALVGAQVDVPGAIAEIHEVKDGRMVRIGKVAVPAKGVVELRPGGLHIMVFKLPRDVGAGAELTLRLEFEKSGEKRTSVRISGEEKSLPAPGGRASTSSESKHAQAVQNGRGLIPPDGSRT